MAPISQNDLSAITATIALAMKDGFAQLTAALSQPVAASRAATAKTTSYRYSTPFLAKGQRASPSDLAAKDQRILNAFTRKGFKDVVLRDRNDPSKPHTVKPFKLWLDSGRVVRRGSKSVAGVFHISQTDPLPASPNKGGKGKGKPQLRTV
jgi:hypothetical protein